MASSMRSGRRLSVGAYASSTSASILWPRSRSFWVTPRCPYPWIRVRRSQSRIGWAAGAALALPSSLAGDRSRRGMGRFPGRERFQLLERAAEGVHGRGEGDAEIALSLETESGPGSEEHACPVEYTSHELHRGRTFRDPTPQIERTAR